MTVYHQPAEHCSYCINGFCSLIMLVLIFTGWIWRSHKQVWYRWSLYSTNHIHGLVFLVKHASINIVIQLRSHRLHSIKIKTPKNQRRVPDRCLLPAVVKKISRIGMMTKNLQKALLFQYGIKDLILLAGCLQLYTNVCKSRVKYKKSLL